MTDPELAPNLNVLILGWSFLEGACAALIMPAIVALVASAVDVAGVEAFADWLLVRRP